MFTLRRKKTQHPQHTKQIAQLFLAAACPSMITWLWDFRLQKSFKYPAVNRFFSHDFRCGGSGCYWFHRQIGVCASGKNSNVDISSEFNLEPTTIVRASQMVVNSKGIICRSRSLVGMSENLYQPTASHI